MKNTKTAISTFCLKTPVLKHFFAILNRLRIARTYNKNDFQYKANAFEHTYKKNLWGNLESRSGGGSELSATATIRKILPIIWKKYSVKTVLDVPCGDFNWMKDVDKTDLTEYIGGDVVQEIVDRNNQLYGTAQIRFEKIDITQDKLPEADMIFCKDCLQHLSDESVWRALHNFMNSDCKYLMTTSYPLTLKNHDILDGDYRPLNLFKKPFNLPKNYINKVREKGIGVEVELDKTMYLWRLSDLKEWQKQQQSQIFQKQ